MDHMIKPGREKQGCDKPHSTISDGSVDEEWRSKRVGFIATVSVISVMIVFLFVTQAIIWRKYRYVQCSWCTGVSLKYWIQRKTWSNIWSRSYNWWIIHTTINFEYIYLDRLSRAYIWFRGFSWIRQYLVTHPVRPITLSHQHIGEIVVALPGNMIIM